MLLTVSSLELLFFFINILFFIMAEGSQLWYNVLYMFHGVRGMIGLVMSRIVPPSHEISSKIKYYGKE